MNIAMVAGALFDSFKNFLQSWIGALLAYIASFIPKTIYLIFTFIFAILDLLQLFFRKAVGLDVLYLTSSSSAYGATTISEVIEGDVVVSFIGKILNNEIPILYNVFISMIILGCILLILTTIVAILRSEYMAEDSKTASKARIFGKSIKALFSFIIVPLTCYFGLIVGNAVLKALDSVTTQASSIDDTTASYFEASPVNAQMGQKIEQVKRNSDGTIQYNEDGTPVMETVYSDSTVLETSYRHISIFGSAFGTTAVPLSGQVFRASAYGANRLRNSTDFKELFVDKKTTGLWVDGNVYTIARFNDSKTGADFLDECFVNTYKLKVRNVSINYDDFIQGGAAETDYMYKTQSGIYGKGLNNQESFYFDKNKVGLVWYFYDLWQFDFVIGLGTLFTMTMIMINIIFAMMKRMFELIILFLVAPPIASIMPLDNGEALKKWRTKFVGKAISAYSVVVCMNLFFILLGILTEITWFGIAPIDYIINAIVAIVGLVTVKDMAATLSEIIGAEDAIKVGQEMQKEVGAKAAGIAKGMMGAAGVVTALGGLGVKAIKGGANGIKASAERAKGLHMAKKDAAASGKDWKSLSKSQKLDAVSKAKEKIAENKAAKLQAKQDKKTDKAFGELFNKDQQQQMNLANEAESRAREKYDDEHGKGSFDKLAKSNLPNSIKKAKELQDKEMNALKAEKVAQYADLASKNDISRGSSVGKGIGRTLLGAGKETMMGVGGVAKRMASLGTHLAQATGGNSDLFKSWKENGGTVSYKAFTGASNKDLDVAKMNKDSYKQAKARDAGDFKLHNEQERKLQAYCASHGLSSKIGSEDRRKACAALGFDRDPRSGGADRSVEKQGTEQ